MPVFYLRRFADDEGRVAVWDLIGQRLLQISPRSFLRERHRSTIRAEDGTADFDLEHRMAALDYKAAPVLDRLAGPHVIWFRRTAV